MHDKAIIGNMIREISSLIVSFSEIKILNLNFSSKSLPRGAHDFHSLNTGQTLPSLLFHWKVAGSFPCRYFFFFFSQSLLVTFIV